MTPALWVLPCVLGFSAPGFSLSVEPASAAQGSLVLVRVRTMTEATPRRMVAKLGGARSHGFPWTGGDLVALLPVGHQERLGTRPVMVEVLDARGTLHRAELHLGVTAGDFDTDELGVSKRFLDPSPRQRAQARADARAFEEAWRRADPVRRWRGSFVAPVEKAVTAPYGTFRTINGRTQSRHLGVDYRGKRGDPVRASNDGRVLLARACFFSGNTVVLDHGGGVHTLYFHLARFMVKAGQVVKKGQVLGAVGDTGRVTGPHLHWGVKVANTNVDPLRLLALDLSADPLASPSGRLHRAVIARPVPRADVGARPTAAAPVVEDRPPAGADAVAGEP
ncbi:MAG: M23 family metallopeptidase [Deltaproteobacteria bacterium]|nr:M23 family metallopeptidase [Deltaproteobacteria bacterium]